MCTVCGRQFHRSDYLKLHSYSHTDERPFNCHICGKGFKMNYNLKVHLRNHENDANNAGIISSSNEDTNFLNENHTEENQMNQAQINDYLNTDNLLNNEQNGLLQQVDSSNDGMVSFLIEHVDIESQNRHSSHLLNRKSPIKLQIPICDDSSISLMNGNSLTHYEVSYLDENQIGIVR